MNLKIVAPALATLMLAGTAYAQQPVDPATDCKVGDTNCRPQVLPNETMPMDSGRSATEMGNPGGAPAQNGMPAPGTPAERNSPAVQQTNPQIEPNDQGSSK